MRNKISLRTLFVLLTVSVLIAALFRYDGQNAWVVGALMFVELVLFTFGLYGLMFCLAYPLGRLSKYFLDQSDEGQSPFATDRLPQQILPPTTTSTHE
jgi:hypothetical protein